MGTLIYLRPATSPLEQSAIELSTKLANYRLANNKLSTCEVTPKPIVPASALTVNRKILSVDSSGLITVRNLGGSNV